MPKKSSGKISSNYPYIPTNWRGSFSKLMSGSCSLKKIPNQLITTYFMLLLKYLLNEYGATYASVCKNPLRPKIGYDLKIIRTTLEFNVIYPDQDPVSKST